MPRLKHAELQALSNTLLELYAPGTLSDFPARLIPAWLVVDSSGRIVFETGKAVHLLVLEASQRTVGKHVERILRKLGVETRTAAVTMAFEVLG